MIVKCIGYGEAFTPQQVNSSFLIEHKEYSILLDCGYNVYPEIVRLGLTLTITHVLLSHLHEDHCGSASILLFHRDIMAQHYQQGRPLTMLYADETHKKELEGHLQRVMGSTTAYCSWQSIEELGWISALDTTGRHMEGFQTYGFVFHPTGEKPLLFTGDLRDTDYFVDKARALGFNSGTLLADTAYRDYGGAHAYYKTVEPYMQHYEVLAYHCSPDDKPADCAYPHVAEKEDWFLSPVQPG